VSAPPDAVGLEAGAIDTADWDACVATMPERTAFHGLAWLEALRDELGASLELVGARRAGEVVAVWPVLGLRRGPLRISGSPLPGWATAYLGPLFREPEVAPAALAAMHAASAIRRSHFSACRVMDDDARVDLAPLGFRCTRRFETYVLDLTAGEEDLWRGLKKECRSRIRKGEKNGVEIVEERDASYLDDFWAMSREVFARAGIAPSYSRNLLRRAHEALFPDRLLAMSACVGGRRIGGVVVLHDDRTALYWAGASRADDLPLAPNNLLHWKAILACRARGMARYDMISTKGSKGRFKKSFGPAAVQSATHWERYQPAAVRLLRDGYERWMRYRRSA
jgi:CelD/BcsL family acetyltransferase involved in cellulose biosynthesis